MSRRARHLSLSLVALAAGMAGALAVTAAAPVDAAAPQTASFTAVDDHWYVTATAGDTTATIAVGGTVAFSYPSGGSAHNVHFADGSSPTSCTQTAGPGAGSTVPPLPAVPTPPPWSGTCRFNTPGTYAFVCECTP